MNYYFSIRCCKIQGNGKIDLSTTQVTQSVCLSLKSQSASTKKLVLYYSQEVTKNDGKCPNKAGWPSII